MIITHPKNPDSTETLYKKFIDRFPEISNLKEQFDVLEQTTKIKSNAGHEVKTRKIIKATSGGTYKNMWDTLCLIKNETKNDDIFAIHQIENMPLIKLRKMTEVIFPNSTTSENIPAKQNYCK